MNSIEIAVRMETDAIKFYTEAADKTSNPVGKKMFLTIVEDEKRHLKYLDAILKDLDIHIADVNPIENVKTVFESMKSSMMKRVVATNDEMEAFKIAMDMEKEGIEFYKNLLSDSKIDKEKELFERLIAEEEKHYAIFSNTYNYLADTGNWFLWQERGIVEG
ncbi:MAG: ferritin family protein [Thermodesulfovibrionales bacterium]|nr:ferritin family protein [Thermodesulfovibrionales bacterium]